MFDIAFMHRYELDSRPILLEISWKKVSDLDVALEEIRDILENYELKQKSQQQRITEESKLKFQSQQQQEAELIEISDQAKVHIQIQKQEFSNNNSEFSESTIIDLESARSIDQDSRIIDQKQQILNKNSRKHENQDQTRSSSDLGDCVGNRDPDLRETDQITAATDEEDGGRTEDDAISDSTAITTASSSVKMSEREINAISSSGSAEVGASAKGQRKVVTNADDNEEGVGKAAKSATPLEQNVKEDGGTMNGGGGLNRHRRVLPIVVRPPVFLAAAFPWNRGGEIQAGKKRSEAADGGMTQREKMAEPEPPLCIQNQELSSSFGMWSLHFSLAATAWEWMLEEDGVSDSSLTLMGLIHLVRVMPLTLDQFTNPTKLGLNSLTKKHWDLLKKMGFLSDLHQF